jgi:hypothetical protein
MGLSWKILTSPCLLPPTHHISYADLVLLITSSSRIVSITNCVYLSCFSPVAIDILFFHISHEISLLLSDKEQLTKLVGSPSDDGMDQRNPPIFD